MIVPPQVVDSFTSAGGERQWELFSLSEARALSSFDIVATGGPDVAGYPALKVGDFEVIGEPVEDADLVRVSRPGGWVFP